MEGGMCVNWDKVQGQKLEGTIWREVQYVC